MMVEMYICWYCRVMGGGGLISVFEREEQSVFWLP